MKEEDKLVQLILEWWEVHQFDVGFTGDDERNIYDEDPEFVKEAKRLKEQKDKEIAKQKALDKLTLEEKKLLGLDKIQ